MIPESSSRLSAWQRQERLQLTLFDVVVMLNDIMDYSREAIADWLCWRGGCTHEILAASVPCTLMVVAATALFSHWQDNHWAQIAIHGAIAAAVASLSKPRGQSRILISKRVCGFV